MPFDSFKGDTKYWYRPFAFSYNVCLEIHRRDLYTWEICKTGLVVTREVL